MDAAHEVVQRVPKWIALLLAAALSLPALAAGSILVFILTFGFFITPAILGGGRVPMVANALDLLINQFARWETAAALSTVLLVVTLACFAMSRWIGARGATS